MLYGIEALAISSRVTLEFVPNAADNFIFRNEDLANYLMIRLAIRKVLSFLYHIHLHNFNKLFIKKYLPKKLTLTFY